MVVQRVVVVSRIDRVAHCSMLENWSGRVYGVLASAPDSVVWKEGHLAHRFCQTEHLSHPIDEAWQYLYVHYHTLLPP